MLIVLAQVLEKGMSPHAGEHTLPLWFGVIPAVLGVLIALYLVYRIISDFKLRRAVNQGRPDPKKFSDYPELQSMVDHFYLARHRIRQSLDANENLDAKRREALLDETDQLIEQGLTHAESLRTATESDEIIAERAALADIQRQLDAIATDDA